MAPTLDVAALSAMMDGMIPWSNLALIVCSETALMFSHFVDICSLTWQSGGVVSANVLLIR